MSDDNEPRRRNKATVPDATFQGEDSNSDTYALEDILGAEAGIPFGVTSAHVPSRFPDAHAMTPEAEEYESRIQAQMSPVFSMAPRRRPPLEWMWKRWRRFAMRNKSGVVDDFGRDPVYTARVESVLDLLSRRYFKVSVAGVEQIPKSGPALLIANHAGRAPWDAILFSHAMQRLLPSERLMRTLIDDRLFYFPYLGVFLNRIGAVRACADNALRLLERQTLVTLFPESPTSAATPTATDGSELGPFGRGGFVRLAVKTGAPLVPVGITCTENGGSDPQTKFPGFVPVALHAGDVLPRRAAWKFSIGTPIHLPKHTSEDPNTLRELAMSVREAVQKLVQEKNDNKDFVPLD